MIIGAGVEQDLDVCVFCNFTVFFRVCPPFRLVSAFAILIFMCFHFFCVHFHTFINDLVFV